MAGLTRAGQTDSEEPYLWDCREIDVPHTAGLVHERGTEDGLPNYAAQKDGQVRVTICSKCHPRIPGHIVTVMPDTLEAYFGIEDTDELFDALPRGFSGSGASRNIRERIMRHCVNGPYNPYQGHAGKTFRAALAYQLDRPEWKPTERQR